jgi:queuine tRNA-ribosyltransferase catalytic subunit
MEISFFVKSRQDSGGFQLVSLSKFTTITEEGAMFESPFTGEPTMLTVSIFLSHAHGILIH